MSFRDRTPSGGRCRPRRRHGSCGRSCAQQQPEGEGPVESRWDFASCCGMVQMKAVDSALTLPSPVPSRSLSAPGFGRSGGPCRWRGHRVGTPPGPVRAVASAQPGLVLSAAIAPRGVRSLRQRVRPCAPRVHGASRPEPSAAFLDASEASIAARAGRVLQGVSWSTRREPFWRR